MKRLKLYLDTSVPNFALAKDISAEDRQITKDLCEEINSGKFDAYISEVVVREISNTKDTSQKDKLVKLIEDLRLGQTLEVNNEIVSLAKKYISENIIPSVNMDDALHIALTSANELDVLVSWNFKHLVKHKTRIAVSGVNTLLGYKNIDICTPREVVENV